MARGNYFEYAQITLKAFDEAEGKACDLLVNETSDMEIARVLDVGCGAGLQLLPFAQKTKAKCFGIDVGEEVGEIGSRLFRDKGLLEKGVFLRAKGEYLPFADESFDVVICWVALPYMENRLAISEIARVMKKSGRFFLKTHAPVFYLGMIKERAAMLSARQLAYPIICLAGGMINLFTGKQPKGEFWKGKEVFQTRSFLNSELRRNGLRITKELKESNRQTPSFVIEKIK